MHTEPMNTAPGRKPALVFLVAVMLFLLAANAATFVLLNRQLAEVRTAARAHITSADARVRERVAQETAALAAQVEALRAELSAGEAEPPEDAPRFAIINAHDHLFYERHLANYLPAAERLGVVRTLFVASSNFTMMGEQYSPADGNDVNTQEILRVREKYPDQVVAYCTLHPDDPDKVVLLERYRQAGAAGLKLYTGHGSFYDRPMDAEEMQPVYAWCEQEGFPICWHVNLSRPDYADEFERVMARYPRLKVIVPHFGVTFYRPGGAEWQRFWALVDKYPGLYTDCSWGTRGILVHALEVISANPDIFRDVFTRYQDRILWGTDMVVTGNKEKTEAWIASVLRACRNMLERPVYHFWMAADGCEHAFPRTENPEGRLNGLALPEPVLRKIYETNYPAFEALRL